MAKGKIQRGKSNAVKLSVKEKRAKKKAKAVATLPVTVIKK